MFPKVSVKTMGAVIPLSWGNAQVLRSIWISMKNLFFSHLCVKKGLSKLRMSLAGGRAGESKQWSDIRLVTASRCAGAFLYWHLRSSSRPLSSMLTSFRCQRSIEEPCSRYVWELGVKSRTNHHTCYVIPVKFAKCFPFVLLCEIS